MFPKYNAMILIGLVVFVVGVHCEEFQEESIGRQLIEQGRTFVHHAVKRLAIIAPIIFFKLGMAFTLLVLVTIVSVNNGIIGFMLLVVGLSSVLARMQEARTSPSAAHHLPVIYQSPAHYGSHHFLDRSDSVEPSTKGSNIGVVSPYTNYLNSPYSNLVYSGYN